MAINWERPLSPDEQKDRAAKRRLSGAIALVALVVAAAGALYWMASEANPRLSAEDLCPTDRPVSGEVIVILDATSPWNPIQQAVIEREFRVLQNRLDPLVKVILYALTDVKGPLPEPALTLCNPGNIEDVQVPLLGPSGTVLVTNRGMIEERWEKGFNSKLDSIFALETASRGTDQSLLAETIQGAAIQAWAGRESVEGAQRSLYVISDMLQNSSLYSHYRDPEWSIRDGERLADLGEAGTQALKGVEVQIFLLDRDIVGGMIGHMRSDLVGFWDAFFSAQGALVTRVRMIEG